MNTLIGEAELKLVGAIAGSMHARLPAQVQLSDLISAGEEGLIKAARRFDPSRGVPFRLFAQHHIRFAMLDSMRACDPLPKEQRAEVRRIEDARLELCHQLGRFPERAEIAARLGLEVATVDQLLSAAEQHDGVRGFARNRDGEAMDDLAQVPDAVQTEAATQWREVRELLAVVDRGLLPRERRVLEMYFLQEIGLREIGEVMGIHTTRVSQIKDAALAKAREIVRRRGLTCSGDVLPLAA